MLQVASMLVDGGDALPESSALASLWRKLTEKKHVRNQPLVDARLTR
jgi:hypothetical protein